MLVFQYCIGDHSFSTYVKFSEKLTFLTLWYTHVLVHVHNVFSMTLWQLSEWHQFLKKVIKNYRLIAVSFLHCQFVVNCLKLFIFPFILLKNCLSSTGVLKTHQWWRAPYHAFPVTFPNEWISPQVFLTFSFNTFATLLAKFSTL